MPFVPLSHSFVERLIRTIRHECLDQTLFWTADLEMKLHAFKNDYNGYRAHASLEGRPPASTPDEAGRRAGPPFASMAAVLSRTVSDADRGVRHCVTRTARPLEGHGCP